MREGALPCERKDDESFYIFFLLIEFNLCFIKV